MCVVERRHDSNDGRKCPHLFLMMMVSGPLAHVYVHNRMMREAILVVREGRGRRQEWEFN